jgi:hypothetical protein
MLKHYHHLSTLLWDHRLSRSGSNESTQQRLRKRRLSAAPWWTFERESWFWERTWCSHIRIMTFMSHWNEGTFHYCSLILRACCHLTGNHRKSHKRNSRSTPPNLLWASTHEHCRIFRRITRHHREPWVISVIDLLKVTSCRCCSNQIVSGFQLLDSFLNMFWYLSNMMRTRSYH